MNGQSDTIGRTDWQPPHMDRSPDMDTVSSGEVDVLRERIAALEAENARLRNTWVKPVSEMLCVRAACRGGGVCRPCLARAEMYGALKEAGDD